MFKRGETISPMDYAKALVKAELLEAENVRLIAQVDRLQEALVAATAPKAYDAMQYDKVVAIADSPEIKTARQMREEDASSLRQYLEEIEKPTFADADELIMSLGRIVGVNPGNDQLPGNTES